MGAQTRYNSIVEFETYDSCNGVVICPFYFIDPGMKDRYHDKFKLGLDLGLFRVDITFRSR